MKCPAIETLTQQGELPRPSSVTTFQRHKEQRGKATAELSKLCCLQKITEQGARSGCLDRQQQRAQAKSVAIYCHLNTSPLRGGSRNTCRSPCLCGGRTAVVLTSRGGQGSRRLHWAKRSLGLRWDHGGGVAAHDLLFLHETARGGVSRSREQRKNHLDER